MWHNRIFFFVCVQFFSVGVVAQTEKTLESCQAPECTVVKRGNAKITVADVTAKVRVMEPKQQDALLSSDKQLNKMLEDMLVCAKLPMKLILLGSKTTSFCRRNSSLLRIKFWRFTNSIRFVPNVLPVTSNNSLVSNI